MFICSFVTFLSFRINFFLHFHWLDYFCLARGTFLLHLHAFMRIFLVCRLNWLNQFGKNVLPVPIKRVVASNGSSLYSFCSQSLRMLSGWWWLWRRRWWRRRWWRRWMTFVISGVGAFCLIGRFLIDRKQDFGWLCSSYCIVAKYMSLVSGFCIDSSVAPALKEEIGGNEKN